MSERIKVSLEKKNAYDIVIEHSFEALELELNNMNLKNKKICIISDETVASYYKDEIVSIAERVCDKVITFLSKAGEEYKNLTTIESIYELLIQEKFDRSDILIALGGGVIGDMTGFVAATYLRGVSFIQIPTSLLAQVDSSIGGKTGVDFNQYKNMVGAFKMPSLVYINISTLQTLDDKQYYNGFAEVMKHGLIKDASYYEWLISNMYEIQDRIPLTLEEMIVRSCKIKKEVVEKDPYEQGERALLNLGHTIGHAIEKNSNFTLLHGECVALGCIVAAYISWKKELLTMDEYYEIRDMFVPFSLPISITDIDPEVIFELTLSDKKMVEGKIKFILLKKIGKAIVDTSVTREEILAGIREILYTYDSE
ncbi:MAG: 3-dehydroquinate synthase [Lachnospiraceae bacterium]